MQAEEQLADLPEALPLRRVSPFWLVLALFQALALVVLILVLCVVGLAALRQRYVPPQTIAVATPTLARGAVMGGMFMAGQVEDEEPAEGPNLPYPTREDLKQDHWQTVGKKPDPDNSVALRQKFFGKSVEVWQNTKGFYPSVVVVAPDGESLAFPAGENLMVGTFLDVRMWGDSSVGAGAAAGFVKPGQAYIMGRPREGSAAVDYSYRRIHGVPSWSSDGKQVASARACGQLVRCQIGAQPFAVLPFAGDSPALVPGKADEIVFVRSKPNVKVEEEGATPTVDPTEVVLGNVSTRAVETIIPASGSSWSSPSISWDGSRLAIVSDRGLEGSQEQRWRVFVLPLSGGTPEPVTPPAASVGPICWAPDGKSIVYARSQEPLPTEMWTQGTAAMYRTLDLFHWDFESKRETRLSRGGGNFSPSMSRDGQLFFLSWVEDRTGANLRLRKIELQDALAFASEHPETPPRDATAWIALADEVLSSTGIQASSDGSKVTPQKVAAVADGFATSYQRRFQIPALDSVSAFDQQRRELQAIAFSPAIRDRLALLLGFVEGEFLRKNFAARWALGPGPLQPAGRNPEPTESGSPFALSYQPFLSQARPRSPATRSEESAAPVGPALLSDVLRSSDGRSIVLTNRLEEEKATLQPDPELERGVGLFKQKQPDEAAGLLLKLSRHEKNQRNRYLALHVARILLEHGRKKELLEVMELQRDQPPHDARKYNLLGSAYLLAGEKQPDPEEIQMAIDAFKNALRCDLQFGPAYLNLAQAYEKQHDRRSARLCLLRYLRLQPRGPYVADAQRRLADFMDSEDGR